jgi:hypothetical protein
VAEEGPPLGVIDIIGKVKFQSLHQSDVVVVMDIVVDVIVADDKTSTRRWQTMTMMSSMPGYYCCK